MICIHCKDNGAVRCDATGCSRVTSNVYTPDQCRPCWLRFHGKTIAQSVQPSLPCLYVGDVVKGQHQCDHPAKPLGPIACSKLGCGPTCSGYRVDEPPPPMPLVVVRHLAYHVYPVKDSRWRDSLATLKRYLPLFNGSRTVAVVTDDKSDLITDVRKALGDDVDYLSLPNDPKLREVVTWVPLMSRAMAHAGEGDITFYGHAKGVTRGNNPAIKAWCDALYETCLSKPELVVKQLDQFPVAGPFKKTGEGFADPSSRWHYSGTFFWLRNCAVAKRNWQRVPQDWWGVESWPGVHFDVGEAGELFLSGTVPNLDLYKPGVYEHLLKPELEKWRQGLPTRKELLIEIGGGTRAKGKPWVNVDQCETADVRLDLETDPLPWTDNEVDGVYSSHCFEHVRNLKHLLREIVRVCRPSARFELRVPHWNSDMAMCFDHKQTISETQVAHWADHFPQDWFGGCAKRLRLDRMEFIPHASFAEAKRLFPHMNDTQVMRYVPGTCHEIRFHLEVIPNP